MCWAPAWSVGAQRLPSRTQAVVWPEFTARAEWTRWWIGREIARSDTEKLFNSFRVLGWTLLQQHGS